jgi:excisionase family DNA binding protein
MRRPMTSDHNSSPWLELSEAADYLGVHYTTLRRWADAGQVPCIRTPGGRRRFSRAEMSAFLASMRSGAHGPGQLAAFGARLTHAGLAGEPWYSRLDDSQRAAMRVEGQGLMAVLMQYAVRANGGDVFLEEGRGVASRYGIACQRACLSLAETVSTFVHVRRGIMDSVYQAGALAGAPDPDTWRLYDRMNTFLDNMLLAMLESFEQARALTADPNKSPETTAQGFLP